MNLSIARCTRGRSRLRAPWTAQASVEYQITSNATMVAAMASAYSNGLAWGRRNWGNRAMKNTANLGLVTLVAKPERHPETLRRGCC